MHLEPADDHGDRLTRRAALGAMGAAGAVPFLFASGAAASQTGALGWDRTAKRYTLPSLRYSYDALEPVIDAETMRIHHTKHHAGYVRGLNRALERLAEIRETGDAALVKHWSRELAFHGSGHVNHTMFWRSMAPPGDGGGGEPGGDLAEAIARDFGSFDAFRKHFVAASTAVEASGWGWLVLEPRSGRLLVTQGERQQDLMMTGVTPLLGVDVWEHAYYLKYQNRRSEYVDAFMTVIDWAEVSERFAAARRASE